MGFQPDGVIGLVQHIHLTALGFSTERLKHPFHRTFKAPGDRIPTTQRVSVPQLEIIGVDLEFRSGDNPMGGRIGRIHGIDRRWRWRVIKLHVHGHYAVAVL